MMARAIDACARERIRELRVQLTETVYPLYRVCSAEWHGLYFTV